MSYCLTDLGESHVVLVVAQSGVDLVTKHSDVILPEHSTMGRGGKKASVSVAVMKVSVGVGFAALSNIVTLWEHQLID